MKNFKRLLVAGAIVTMVGTASVTAFAASSYSTPAEAVAGLTGRTVEDVTAEKFKSEKSYGTIAADAGKLEEFHAEMLQIKKDILAERVEAGLITQERADEIIAVMESNQATCDGTGMAGNGQRMGAGFGRMNGGGLGNSQGMRGFGQCGGQLQTQ